MGLSVEKKVGIFFIVGLVLLIVLFEMVGKESLFIRPYTLKAYFTSAAGLREGDPVRLAGVEVGSVSDLRVVGNRVEVTMRIRKGTPVKTDSVASIKLTSLLGTNFVDLSFGSASAPLAQPGMVLASTEPPDLNTFLAKINDVADDIQQLVQGVNKGMEKGLEPLTNTLQSVQNIAAKIERGEGTLGKLLTDETLYRDLKGVTANAKEMSVSLQKVARQVEEGRGTLGKLLTDETLYRDMRAAMADVKTITTDVKTITTEVKGSAASLQRITRDIEAGKGSLGKLIKDEEFYNEAKDVVSGLGRVARRINEGEGTLGRLINDDALYREMKSTITTMNSIVKKIDRGQGTLGKLLNDETLYFTAKDSLKKVGKGADQLREQGPLTVLGIGLSALTGF